MKVVYVKEFGDAENLEIREVDTPQISRSDQVLVNVKAAGLNRADLLQRKGFYPAPEGYPKRILGLEFAGEVVEIGVGVKNLAVGNRVFGITAGGGQAEYVLAAETHLALIPEHMDYIEAAAVPEAYITAYDAAWTQGNLRNGETLLVHAVGSGVGLAALDIAKLNQNRVFGTSRTQDKLDKCEEIGLDIAINTTQNPDFSGIVQEKTNGKGVDVILDLVGASYFESNLQSLASKGRLMLVGLVGGRKSEFDMGVALKKRLKITGTVLRSRTDEEKAKATENFSKYILGFFDGKNLVPKVDRVFRIDDVVKAHRYIESNRNFGKVVLQISDEN